mmetsp:Transcript_51149/g.123489  ORF Transcript_51149/g.123489 Transcript_51149/m.123489 type:complete len:206 (+) Transcript_51149:366-983(+)
MRFFLLGVTFVLGGGELEVAAPVVVVTSSVSLSFGTGATTSLEASSVAGPSEVEGSTVSSLLLSPLGAAPRRVQPTLPASTCESFFTPGGSSCDGVEGFSPGTVGIDDGVFGEDTRFESMLVAAICLGEEVSFFVSCTCLGCNNSRRFNSWISYSVRPTSGWSCVSRFVPRHQRNVGAAASDVTFKSFNASTRLGRTRLCDESNE